MLNDFQGRTLLWMHLPDLPPAKISPATPTTHLDIVPTLLSALGFTEDILLLKADRCSSNRNVATFLRSAKMVFASRFTEPSSPVPTFHGGPIVRANIFSLECNGVTESKCREMIGWARSAHILMRRRKCTKFCRTFHSHLENSTDRESFNQEEVQLARSFSFICSQSS